MDLVADASRTSRPGRVTGWAGRVGSSGLGLALFLAAPGTGLASEEQPGQSPPSGKAEEKLRPRIAAAPAESSESRRVLDINHDEAVASDPIARARRMVADCRARYRSVEDYTCTFFKRERVDGRLYKMHVMEMKARTSPPSLYFKFIQPNAGREAIYVQGRNHDKIVAHDVGLGRVVAGTMHLDPKGDMALEENRHPVTEAGIGSMIDTIHKYWSMDLTPANAQVVLHPHAKLGDRACTMIETTHPGRGPQFLFHKVKLYIDKQLGLPIRFEAYDWPAKPGAEPLLMEEYTYANLRLNQGLKDRDFDHRNAQYSFGRF